LCVRCYLLTLRQIKLSLCLTKHHAMKTYWGVEIQLHAFLTSALDGVSCQLHAPAPLLTGKSPRCPLDRRLSGPQSRSGQDCEDKKKTLHCPCWELISGRPARRLVTILTGLPGLLPHHEIRSCVRVHVFYPQIYFLVSDGVIIIPGGVYPSFVHFSSMAGAWSWSFISI